jgi:hypothetical protein
MILLVTPIEKRNECAAALHEAIGEPVAIAENLPQPATLLRTEFYTAAVLDQYLAETEPHETEMALEQLGAAIPVQVNFAISGTERLVREVRSAVRRRRHEESAARTAAAHALRGKLNSTLTTLLLDSELALETTGLSPAAAERLASVHEAAQKLRAELEAGPTARE